MTSVIQPVGDLFRLSVHATPGAKRNHVGGVHDDALRVLVTAAADQGKANKAIIKLLADRLEISRSQIELRSGATYRRKQFLIADPSGQVVDRVAKWVRMT